VAIGRVVESMLFGISPRDLVTYAAVVMMIVVAAFAACLFPARRAASVEPAAILRSE
jgi:putative ABC transport system permease protein